MENKHQEQLDALKDIRSMMERSNRFLSLSGLSGVWTGVCALIGVTMMYVWLRMPGLAFRAAGYMDAALGNQNWGLTYRGAFLLIGLSTLLAAVLGAFYFSWRKANKNKHQFWSNTAQRTILGLLIPLSFGGIFCFALARYDLVGLIAPTTLVFYGMALIHIDKFTIGNVRILGLAQAILGSIGLFLPQYGLLLWALGFGILHIIYGTWMYLKYERTA